MRVDLELLADGHHAGQQFGLNFTDESLRPRSRVAHGMEKPFERRLMDEKRQEKWTKWTKNVDGKCLRV